MPLPGLPPLDEGPVWLLLLGEAVGLTVVSMRPSVSLSHVCTNLRISAPTSMISAPTPAMLSGSPLAPVLPEPSLSPGGAAVVVSDHDEKNQA